MPATTGSRDMVQESTRPTPGQVFGPYHIERLIGHGGMGEVYEAEHVEQGRRVALKVLHQRLSGREDHARFVREGQLAASINHPHTVYVFGSEEIDGIPTIAMELLPGGTLKDRVKERGPLPPASGCRCHPASDRRTRRHARCRCICIATSSPRTVSSMPTAR